MRPMSELALSALSGSRVDERVVAHVWYDGRVVAPDVPVSQWSVSSDSSRQVQTQVSLTIADPDGGLAPWALSDPLGVGGSRVQLIYTMGHAGTTVDLGWFKIVASDPVENWVFKSAGERIVRVSGGATIPVKADDLTAVVVADRLLAPESPGAGATVLGEVRRLLKDIVPVVVADGVVDKAAPSSVVFERERMDAVVDLLETIGATYRMTGDGQLEVYPSAPGASVWEVAGGEQGVLVDVQRSQSSSGLYNAAVSEGATDDGHPLVGRAFETTGPLRWEGPHWRVPIFHSATGLLKTQAAVDADAATRLRGVVSNRTVTLPVTCLPHPGLQVGDVVTVFNPNVTGADVALTGVVRTIELRGSTSGVSPMQMTVECPYEDVQAVAAAIRRVT